MSAGFASVEMRHKAGCDTSIKVALDTIQRDAHTNERFVALSRHLEMRLRHVNSAFHLIQACSRHGISSVYERCRNLSHDIISIIIYLYLYIYI